jgi:hypothetical protein
MDNLPFFSGNSGTKMSTLGKDQFENPESRIATIQQNKVEMVRCSKWLAAISLSPVLLGPIRAWG